MRAYAEINDFEHQLVAAGAVVVKFWLQISADEQLRRFQERQDTETSSVQDYRRGLAKSRKMGSVRHRGLRHGGPDFHRDWRPGPWSRPTTRTLRRVKVLRTVCERPEHAIRGDEDK